MKKKFVSLLLAAALVFSLGVPAFAEGTEALPAELCHETPGGTPPEGLSPLERVERDAIAAAIRRQQGNLTSAARDLGIAKSTLYVRLEKLGLKEQIAQLRER